MSCTESIDIPAFDAPPGGRIDNAMLAAFIGSDYPAAQREALVDQIINVYNGTVPTTDNETLQYLNGSSTRRTSRHEQRHRRRRRMNPRSNPLDPVAL